MSALEEAVGAALKRMRELGYSGITTRSMTAALEAAAPLIAAAERDRIRQGVLPLLEAARTNQGAYGRAPEIYLGFGAQVEAFTCVLNLIGDES